MASQQAPEQGDINYSHLQQLLISYVTHSTEDLTYADMLILHCDSMWQVILTV